MSSLEEDQRTTSQEALRSPQVDESDIYRGNPPPCSIYSRSLDSLASSSSESFSGRGRLGAIAAVVETAISRWARGNHSGSSSSSSSSKSSSVALSRSQRAKPRRRWSSVNTLQIAQSEHDFVAHINRIKARQESRQAPRHFALYLPPSLLVELPRTKPGSGKGEHTRRIISTTSLPLVLGQLEVALKKAAKVRRGQLQTHIPGHLSKGVRPTYRDFTSLSGTSHFTRSRINANSLPRRKDKHKPEALPEVPVTSTDGTSAKRAWFLDIASPTWEDMRALGKLLHLHPLTLEDILQREPREKLELFPKLGYYFISFRAIESRIARAKQTTKRASLDKDELNSTIHDADSSILGEANVYLVVFNEGICMFHFTDISEHIDRIRNRIVLFEEALNMTSDWIAHGILDSIVDSFYPFLAEIEKEVIAIDHLVFAGSSGHSTLTENETVNTPTAEGKTLSRELIGQHGVESLEMKDRTITSITDPAAGALFSVPKFSFSLGFRYLGFVFTRNRSRNPLSSPQPSATHMTIRRMARTRKLVTSLVRLLASKSEVVSQIRKRLLTSSHAGLGNGTNKYDDIEVAMYMGDVQDHILFLQHSLAHYERMLSQSHPTYLSQLRTVVALTKNGTDKAIIYLTVVSVAVLCVQTLIGAFSLNITIPTNDHSPDGSYHVFGIVIALSSLILCGYLSAVRWWWIQAKRRRGAIL